MHKSQVYSFVIILLLLSENISGQAYNNQLFIPPVLSGNNFNLSFNASTRQFFPGLTTDTYGINGDYLGPTLVFQKNDSVFINVTNNLFEVTSCHWHGLHVPALYDGGPHTTINPGTTWYAHFKVLNNAGTYWYHPHVHMNTLPQVNSGLAGMIIVKDSAEGLLNLPRTYGVDDFPVILQDKKYSISGQMLANALGDSMQVNGTIHPYLNCPAQIVRLRLLNGSNARVYNLGFSDQRNFYVIGNDGGLIDQPYSTNRLLLANGERVEILIDLSVDTPGTSFILKSFASEMASDIPGAITGMMGGNGPLEAVDFNIMQLNVITPTANPVLTVPVNLIPLSPWNPVNANRIRYKEVSGLGMVSGQGNFMMDNTTYDHMIINDTMRLGDIEIWNIANNSNMAHPMHIHDVQFYILHRNGSGPGMYEKGLKDVVLVKPGETVSLITKFEDFSDDSIPYMYHCHNLAHEDMGMMLQFIVTSGTSGVGAIQNTDHTYIYPNPTSDYWQLQLNSYPEKVNLYNMQGEKVTTPIIISSSKMVSVGDSQLQPGIYILKISYKERDISKTLVKY
ncbi:MAG: multicopper oxidase domain-containing protein [Bacteroidota bacterium]